MSTQGPDAERDAGPLAGHTVELCTSRGGFEVTPRQPRELDLSEQAERFEDAEMPIVTDAGVLLVVDAGPCEVSVFESGRLLAKTEEPSDARQAARRVLDVLEGSA